MMGDAYVSLTLNSQQCYCFLHSMLLVELAKELVYDGEVVQYSTIVHVFIITDFVLNRSVLSR